MHTSHHSATLPGPWNAGKKKLEELLAAERYGPLKSRNNLTIYSLYFEYAYSVLWPAASRAIALSIMPGSLGLGGKLSFFVFPSLCNIRKKFLLAPLRFETTSNFKVGGHQSLNFKIF